MTRVNLGDISLQVLVEGAGPPLLFVHGFPLDHTMWRGQISHFSRTHRVIAPDLRGFGQSGVTPGTVTMARFADDLAALLDRLGVTEPVCFCGLSMGGAIAWQFVQRHRLRVRSLVICDARALPDTPEGRQTRYTLAERVLKEGPEFVAATMPERLFSKRTRAEKPDIVADVQSVIRRTRPDGIAAGARGLGERPDMTGFLPQIDIPTLLIVGEEDVISTVDEMRSMAAAIPGAEFVSVPGAGHMAPLEESETVNAAMTRFLQRVG
jgi:pimeloyl-ACP methyl ester carboxylesterase